VRLRLATPLVVLALFLSATSASAYPWPLKPFDKQHAIRANFGDPRTRFLNTMLTDGLAGPGTFLFHNVIDIPAPEGTSVYLLFSGRANLLAEAAVLARAPVYHPF